MNSDRPLRALVYMLAAQFFFSSNILLLRITERTEQESGAGAYHMSPWEPMLCRSLLMSAWCLLSLWRVPGRTLEGRENFWLWARGVAGVLSLTAYYYGVLHIPLGMASLFSNSSPLYVTLLALFFTGEILSRRGWLALIGGFAGVALVASGAGSDAHAIAWGALAIAALSGPLSATAYFSIRQLKRIRNEQIMLSLGLAGSILSLLVILWRGEQFPRSEGALFFLMLSTLPAILAQECLTRAFRSAPASQVTPLQYTGPIFSTVLAWIFLDESLPWVAGLGIALVLFCGLFLPLLEASRGLRSQASGDQR